MDFHVFDHNRSIHVYNGKWFYILLSQLVYCKTNSDFTYVYMSDFTRYMISGNLTETERLIHSVDFLRIHKPHLVNLEYFNELDFKTGHLTLNSCECDDLYLSRAKKKILKAYIESFPNFLG